jgi:hypothetical protein
MQRSTSLLIFATVIVGAALVYTISTAPAPTEPTALAGSLPAAASQTLETPAPEPLTANYIEVTDSCGPYYGGACVNVRSGPGAEYPVVMRLRTGMVLRTSGEITTPERTWNKITFDEWLRYPERVQGDLFVAAEFVTPFTSPGPEELSSTTPRTHTNKRILVDRSDQMLYAYEGDELFMEEKVSTGLELSPTPRGSFRIFRKTPSRYMQGPVPEVTEDSYDMPGVPWNMYFTEQGGAIHGAYWHDHFGSPWSHGCVNLPIEKAKELYQWADLGTEVIVRD